MRNLEAVLETIRLMKDVQSNPLIKRCMIVLKKVSDLEMDLQCLPIKKRATIVHVRIIGQVTGSATCSHQESCNDDTDLREDGNWAIEKQNIARPPIGWERVLKIRGSRRTRFADVYVLLYILLKYGLGFTICFFVFKIYTFLYFQVLLYAIRQEASVHS